MFALHLTVSPRGRRHPLLGVPTDLLLGFHPFLACAATRMLTLLLSVSPHPLSTPLPRRALATALFATTDALCVGAAAAMLPEDAGWAAVAGLGFRGAVLGAIFVTRYFGRRRWLLQFPVVQVSRVDWEKLWFLIISHRKQFGVF
jgi:nucleoporin NDC1